MLPEITYLSKNVAMTPGERDGVRGREGRKGRVSMCVNDDERKRTRMLRIKVRGCIYIWGEVGVSSMCPDRMQSQTRDNYFSCF